MHEPETCARRAGEHHVRADRWLAFARRARSTWAFAARAIPTEDPQRVTEASDEGCRDDDLCARCLPCRRSRDKIAKEVRIRSGQALPLHYLAADRAGHVVVIEFLDGELRARTGGDLPVPVLTNSTYADSLTHLGRHKGFGGEVGLPVAPVPGITSLARFVVAASGRAESTDSDPIGRAFDTLARARQSSSTPGGIGTRWSIVYELGPLRAHFRTERRAAIRRVDLAGLNFACTRLASMLDIDAPLEGDVTARFTPYSAAANYDVVMRSVRKTPFLAGMPVEQIRALAQWPERARSPDVWPY
jgi:hypothetical protein